MDTDDAAWTTRRVLLTAGTLGVAAWLVAYWTAPGLVGLVVPVGALSAAAVVAGTPDGAAARRLAGTCLGANLVAGAGLFVYGVVLGGVDADPFADPVVVAVVVGGQTALVVGGLAVATLAVRAVLERL